MNSTIHLLYFLISFKLPFEGLQHKVKSYILMYVTQTIETQFKIQLKSDLQTETYNQVSVFRSYYYGANFSKGKFEIQC